jgi:hypothetical protein
MPPPPGPPNCTQHTWVAGSHVEPPHATPPLVDPEDPPLLEPEPPLDPDSPLLDPAPPLDVDPDPPLLDSVPPLEVEVDPPPDPEPEASMPEAEIDDAVPSSS